MKSKELSNIIKRNEGYLGKPILDDRVFFDEFPESDEEIITHNLWGLLLTLDTNLKIQSEENLRRYFNEKGNGLYQFAMVYHIPELIADVFATQKDYHTIYLLQRLI